MRRLLPLAALGLLVFCLAPAFAAEYASTDVPKAIPDVTTITSTLTIADAGTIDDIDVHFNISHSYSADLIITLIGPGGSPSCQLTNNWWVGDTYLDDEGSAPYSPLSVFDGGSMTGTWTLQVADVWGFDSGTLNSWSLIINSEADQEPILIGGTDLIAGRGGPDVGDVMVGWDPDTGELGVYIAVEDALDGDLKIDETHLYVGSTPPDTSSPGQFPFMHEDLGGVDEDLYDFGEIGTAEPGDIIYLAVQADLTDDLGTDMNGDEVVDELDYALYPKHGAWGDGSLIGATPKNGGGKGNWSMYFTATVPEEDE